jgi:hypothetical protein
VILKYSCGSIYCLSFPERQLWLTGRYNSIFPYRRYNSISPSYQGHKQPNTTLGWINNNIIIIESHVGNLKKCLKRAAQNIFYVLFYF